MAEKKLKKRSEMEKKYQWRLEDIYPGIDEWNQDVERIKELLAELETYEGRLSESAEVLAEFLQKKEYVEKMVEAVYVYANQKYHEDTTAEESQKIANISSGMMALNYCAVSFVEPEILEIPEETLAAFEKENPVVAVYKRWFDLIIRQKEHTLSKDEEQVLANMTELSEIPSNIFSMFDNADVVFPTILDENGEETVISHARYGTLLRSHDRRVRREAFYGLHNTYLKFKNTLGACYIGKLKKDICYANIRKYPTALSEAMFIRNIPEEVYHALIETVNDNLSYLHQYMDLKKEVLGVDELHLYDVYAPLNQEFRKTIGFEEAKEIVKKALVPLGEAYGKVLAEGLEGGWIDVYENEGKRSGAYSWGAYGTHPYVLLNYEDQLNDVFTLAHEMGHAMHSYFSDSAQPYPYAGYQIFVAEVASTCNEALLMEYFLAHTEDKKEKAYLLNYFMEQFRTTLYRQTMFAEFELEAHRLQEYGSGVAAEELCRFYLELNKKYFGNHVAVDKEIEIEWARIPHFYNSTYYVYQYATGYAAAIALSRRILKEGEPAVKDYLEFLRGGSSQDPIDLLRGAGVDMTKKDPVQSALDLFRDLIAEYRSCLE